MQGSGVGAIRLAGQAAIPASSMMVLVHELRSPAAASKSLVAACRRRYAQDAELDGFLGRVEKRMDHLLELVSDLLDLSQATAGRPLGPAVKLDLAAEIRAICGANEEEAAAKGLAMRVELPASPVWVHMPEKSARLIVSNLVSNAVKYTPAGSVKVRLQGEAGWATLLIHDTGIGIPPAEVGHLFTEFFRASNARRGSTPGTGVGLAAVKALVESCHGKLGLESRENEGSTFTVRLPLWTAQVDQPVEPGPVAEASPG